MQFYICSVLDGCSILDAGTSVEARFGVLHSSSFGFRFRFGPRSNPPSTQSWDNLPTLLLGPSVNNEKKKKKEKDAVIPV